MKFFKIFLISILFLFPIASLAAENMFKAEVVEIIQEENNVLPDGTEAFQQNLKLKILDGRLKDQEVTFNGIDSYDAIKKNIYTVGDKVLVLESLDFEGNPNYYITDYIRTSGIYWLFGVFVFILLLVGRFKGFRSLLSLAISFWVIIKFIIPKILAGSNPVTITIFGSLIILLAIIYITEGINKKSHIAVFSIFFSLIIAVFLSWFFVGLTKLSGLTGEEVFSLVNIGGQAINFKGLLLAGIIIGALGVLDDVVISQISTVEQIIEANEKLSRREVFKRSYEVGVSHISSMTNTLFLAYAGTSLSLLILFISGESAFSSWSQIINNEQIATEIVRALAGSIGLILSVPIATYVAAMFLKNKK